MSKNKMIMLPSEVVEQALEALLNEGEFRKLLKPLIEKSIDSIRDALEQPDAGPTAATPAGWKLVPVEPTRGMLYDIQEFSHILPPRGKRIWAHMLAAAPHPPTTEESLTVEQQQGEQEPYLYYDPANGDTWTQEAINDGCCLPDGLIALYANQKQAQLTVEQIDGIVNDLDPIFLDTPTGFEEEFCRAIERTHGIGGKE